MFDYTYVQRSIKHDLKSAHVLRFSERESWQKERDSFAELKSKLEEQREVDTVKIKEFNVSLDHLHLKLKWCLYLLTCYLNLYNYNNFANKLMSLIRNTLGICLRIKNWILWWKKIKVIRCLMSHASYKFLMYPVRASHYLFDSFPALAWGSWKGPEWDQTGAGRDGPKNDGSQGEWEMSDTTLYDSAWARATLEEGEWQTEGWFHSNGGGCNWKNRLPAEVQGRAMYHSKR